MLAQVAAAVWVVWLAWGRAYLGLHSPLDLATGSLLGVTLLQLWISFESTYTSWLQATVIQQWWQLPLQVLVFSAVLMRCYPMPSRWTSCYSYATAWAAGWAGCTLGWAVLQQAQLATTVTSNEWLVYGCVPPLACKIFLGLGLVAASKVLVKAALMTVFKQVFPLVPEPVRRLWQPPVVGAVRQQHSQQQGRGCFTGYASAVLSEVSDGVAAHRAGTQSNKLHPVPVDSNPTQVTCIAQPSDSQQQKDVDRDGAEPTPKVGWGLRHTEQGLGNDVVAAARWCSYLAVGLTVLLWQAGWPLVLQTLAPSISVS